MFGELWMNDTLMTDADYWNDKEDLGSQNLLTSTKKLCFKEIENILKSPKHSRIKKSESSKSYFKPRSNVKRTKKRGIFRNMAFKSYLQLSLPITIQHVNTYSATETKTLEAIAAIWRVLTSIDSESVILAWYPKVGETLRPLKTMDCIKILTKNAVNDKYIKLILIGWFARSTIIRFRLGYNLSIDAILEDPHFSYTLDNYEANLTREKIQSTETAITVWLGGGASPNNQY